MGKLRDIISSKQVQNVGKLLSANVVAQVIGLVVYPILSRMYAPEDFGLLNLFLSIGNVLVVLSLVDYYYAIVLPKQERHAVALVHVSSLALLITVALVAVSVLLASPISAVLVARFGTILLAHAHIRTQHGSMEHTELLVYTTKTVWTDKPLSHVAERTIGRR